VILLAAFCGSGSRPSPSSPPCSPAAARALRHRRASCARGARSSTRATPGAEVVQAQTELKLRTLQQAIRWNASLPCSGRIVSIQTDGDTATATFVLGNRQQSKCDGPGQRATTIVRVHKGKIVLWHQTSAAPAPVGPTV
jgi:hypothetical protein